MDCELTAARTEGNQTSCGWTHVLVYIAAWTQCDKKKTITWAGSKWTIWLLVTLWNSCNLAAGLLVANYLVGSTAVAVWQFGGVAQQQQQQLGIVALRQLVAWLLGRANNCRARNQKKMQPPLPDINSPKLCFTNQKVWISSLDKSGSGVWIKSLDFNKMK